MCALPWVPPGATWYILVYGQALGGMHAFPRGDPMDGQNASNAILAQGSQLRAADFDPPTRASGLRWLPALSGGAGSLRSWSTCVRGAVIRVFFCSCSRGTGLSNSQASGCALVRGLPSQARVWGGQPLVPLPAAVAAVFPSRQGWVCPPPAADRP